MTLGEFSDAVDGFGELESQRQKWMLFNTRKICYYAVRPHLKEGSEFKESDLYSIPDLDEEIEELRIKNLPLITVVQDGGN